MKRSDYPEGRFWGLWLVPLLEYGRELGILSPCSCDVDKLSDLRSFEGVLFDATAPGFPEDYRGTAFGL